MAEVRKMGDYTVNDGKGLYDNEGLLDSIIVDCENAVKQLTTGNHLAWCGIMYSMAQKLICLKNGIKNESDSMKNKIEELKRMNNDLLEQVTGLPVDNSALDTERGTDNGND